MRRQSISITFKLVRISSYHESTLPKTRISSVVLGYAQVFWGFMSYSSADWHIELVASSLDDSSLYLWLSLHTSQYCQLEGAGTARGGSGAGGQMEYRNLLMCISQTCIYQVIPFNTYLDKMLSNVCMYLALLAYNMTVKYVTIYPYIFQLIHT